MVQIPFRLEGQTYSPATTKELSSIFPFGNQLKIESKQAAGGVSPMATNPFGIEVSPEQQAEYDRIFGVSPEVKRERALLKINQKQAAGEEVTAEDYASLFGAPTNSSVNLDAFLPPASNTNIKLDVAEGSDPFSIETTDRLPVPGYDRRGFPERTPEEIESGDVAWKTMQDEAAANPIPEIDPRGLDFYTGGFPQTFTEQGGSQLEGFEYTSGDWDNQDNKSKIDRVYETDYIHRAIKEIADYLGLDPSELSHEWDVTKEAQRGDRTIGKRETEGAWQQKDLTKLIELAKNTVGKGFSGLDFNPPDFYQIPEGEDSQIYTHELNRANYDIVQSLYDLIGKGDETYGPYLEDLKSKSVPKLTDYIQSTYKDVFNGEEIDQEGLDYWLNQLLYDPDNAIPIGGTISGYLEEAFKNTEDYKDWEVAQGPTQMSPGDLGVDPMSFLDPSLDPFAGGWSPHNPWGGYPGAQPPLFDSPSIDNPIYQDPSSFAAGTGGGIDFESFLNDAMASQAAANQETINSIITSNQSNMNNMSDLWSNTFNTMNQSMFDQFNTLSQNQTRWQDQFSNTFGSRLDDLKTSFGDFTKSNESLIDRFREDQTQWQADQRAYQQRRDEAEANRRYQEAAYGEKTANREVKGVRTLNELPGYSPKFKGTRGHFNRGGSRLKTSSLNVA